MIRVAAFLIFTVALAVVAVWFADRPGTVDIIWLGYHTETSVAVVAAAGVATACVAMLLFSALRMVVAAPAALARRSAQRRAERGRSAIARGLVAIGAGDVGAAQQFAAQARQFGGNEPLALLLAAQAAQLSGDPVGADAAFRTLAERPDTRLFGLRGLFIERNAAMIRRPYFCRGSGANLAIARLGRRGSASIPLPRWRLAGRHRGAGAQSPRWTRRQGQISPPARRIARCPRALAG